MANSRPLERIAPVAFWTLLWSASLALHGFRGDVQTDLAIGRWILQHHAVPHHNWWSASAYGQPFANSEWLFALGVVVLDGWGGRLAIYGAGVAGLATLAWLASAWLPPGRWRWVFVLMLGVLILPVVPPRPELVSYVGWAFALTGILRYRATENRRLLWKVAGSTVLWTQIHASVVLVPLLLGAEALLGPRNRWRVLLGPLLVALLGTLLRVGGPLTGGAFVSHVLTPAILNTVVEWMPPNPRSFWGVFVYGWCFASWMIVGHRAWQARDWRALTWLTAGTAAALFAQRLVPYMALGTLILWQPVFADVPVPVSPRSPWRYWDNEVLALAVLVAVWSPVVSHGLFRPTWPPAVLRLLQQQRASNIVALQGDSLTGAGLLPWINGQVQLDAGLPWWPAWVATVQGRVSPTAFVARYDPTSRWIVWPTHTRPGFSALSLPTPWHVVWQGPMRWGSGLNAVPTAVWTR